MMEMKEQTGSRKKLLVPVVVLMLCLVTLTGAAYAYSSTLTNTGNNVSSGYLSIDLKQDGGVVAGDAFTLADDRSVVTFTDNFAYAAGEAPKTNQIGFALAENKLIVTYKVTIARETGNTSLVDLVVSAPTAFMTQNMFTAAGTMKTMAELFDVKVSLDSGSAQAIVADTNDYRYTFDDVALGNHTITLVFDGKIADGFTTAGRFTIGDAEAPENDTASDWYTAIGTKAFALTFEAVSA